MLKRLIAAGLFAVALGAAAIAANLPLISGPLDPANEQAIYNGLVQSINGGVDGLIGTSGASTSTTGTALTGLATYSVNGGTLATPGQMLHVHAWGLNSADTNPKTVTISFGGAAPSSQAFLVTGSGIQWDVNFWIMVLNSTQQITEGVVSLATPSTGTVLSQALIAQPLSAQTNLIIQGTAAASGSMQLTGSYVEQIK